MNTIDTRDLIETRNDLKQQILDNSNERFNTEHADFDDIGLFLNDEASKYITDEEREEFEVYWSDEFKQIAEIDNIENECEEFEYGCTLVDENDFEEYCEEELEQCGYFDKDFPQWIKNNIDWEGIASDMKEDYQEVDYQGTSYLYR